MEKTKKTADKKHAAAHKAIKTKKAKKTSMIDAAIIGAMTPPFAGI